jgi:hypothetical protein
MAYGGDAFNRRLQAGLVMARQKFGISRQYESAEETQRSELSSRCDCRDVGMWWREETNQHQLVRCGRRSEYHPSVDANCPPFAFFGHRGRGKATSPVESVADIPTVPLEVRFCEGFRMPAP